MKDADHIFLQRCKVHHWFSSGGASETRNVQLVQQFEAPWDQGNTAEEKSKRSNGSITGDPNERRIAEVDGSEEGGVCGDDIHLAHQRERGAGVRGRRVATAGEERGQEKERQPASQTGQERAEREESSGREEEEERESRGRAQQKGGEEEREERGEEEEEEGSIASEGGEKESRQNEQSHECGVG